MKKSRKRNYALPLQQSIDYTFDLHVTNEFLYQASTRGLLTPEFPKSTTIDPQFLLDINHWLLRINQPSMLDDPGLSKYLFGKRTIASSLIQSIFAWNAYSRRVFFLGHKMQRALDSISLEGLRVSDLRFPFEAFLISLEDGIKLAEKGNYYHHILVYRIFGQHTEDIRDFDLMPEAAISQIRGQKVYGLALIPTRNRHHIVRTSARKYMVRAIKSGYPWGESDIRRIDSALNYLKQLEHEDNQHSNRPLHIYMVINEKMVTDLIERLSEEYGEGFGKLFSQLVNLCMYLTALPPKQFSEVVSDNVRSPKFPGGIVVKEDAVFQITTMSKLEFIGESRSVNGQEHEKSPHWRRGYWRRPAGQGSNPNAKRTVFVRPALVRSDLLPLEGVPAGLVSQAL